MGTAHTLHAIAQEAERVTALLDTITGRTDLPGAAVASLRAAAEDLRDAYAIGTNAMAP